jgi:anti-sigma-K factor RskA
MSQPAIDNIHLYAGAYALDALPLDERAGYERHLASCEMCQQDVGDYAETAARLAAAAASSTPPLLRTRVLTGADAVRQVPPHVSGPVRSTRRPSRALAGIAAGLAAAVMGLSGVSALLHHENQQVRAELAAAAADADVVELLLAAATVPLEAPDGVTAGFAVQRGRGTLVVRGLAELDAGQDYQLWLFHGGVPVPAGVFRGDAEGVVTLDADAQVRGAELVAVTVEPAGGVAQPTGSIVLSAAL